jgi:hypothetical protein
MKTISVPYDGKGRKVNYKLEVIDLSMTPVNFMNVYSVFIEDPDLRDIAGEHFTILHNQIQTIKPVFDVNSPGNVAEFNLKKEIAQQIINDPATR